jgi:hypothetical protein
MTAPGTQANAQPSCTRPGVLRHTPQKEPAVPDDNATIPRAPRAGNEAEMCERLERHFERLAADGRCIWQGQVRMRLPAFPGDLPSQVRHGRIDYVVQLDGGFAIGVEAKLMAGRMATLGDHLRQCHDYTRGVVAPQVLPEGVPWMGKPLFAVFLACEIPAEYPTRPRDWRSVAVRLMSSFRVGFLSNHRWQGLHLSLGGERWWSEAYQYRADAFSRVRKLGHGKRQTGGNE